MFIETAASTQVTVSEGKPTLDIIIQIPCLNEADTLHQVISELPETWCGVYSVESLVVDDGSHDGTAAVAIGLGVKHVVRHRRNRGLAAAFSTGLDTCLRLGADIIVNTDGDGQYPTSAIPRLLEPILAGRADVVIGDRRPWADRRQSWVKRRLQKLGSRFVSYLAGREIPDAVSGFRAMTREAALQTHIVTGFSYTIESILQACSRGLAIEFVPITTNSVERPSRLFHSIPQFLTRSGMTMLRVFFMFRPLRVLVWLSVILGAFGLLPVLRFLYLYWRDGTAGHVQSLILGAVLIILSGMALVAGLFADLIATNRRLAEMTLERVKRMECDMEARKRKAVSSKSVNL